MEYEQYHQKGGSYVLPVEIFNDLLNEKEELQQENQELKAQYCERTDCSGRIGNSKKVEQLQTEKEQLTSLVNSCQEEIRRLKKELQALKVSDEEWLEKSDK